MELTRLLQPVWKGTKVYEESAMYVEGSEEVRLMYPPLEIESVRDYTGKLFREGADYERTEEGLRFLPDGKIPRMKEKDFYPEKAEKDFFYLRDGGLIFFTEGGFFHRKQVRVTYTHAPSSLYAPQTLRGSLRRTKEKIAEGRLRLLFYGDSITCGANASAEIFFPPYQNAYPKLVAAGLQRRNKYAAIEYANTAEGGQTSEWGLKNVKERVLDRAPDLLVLAFGMNDGTWYGDENVFDRNIRGILDRVRGELPETEVILVSSALANPLPCMKTEEGVFIPFCGIQEKYPPVLERIAREYGVSFANVTRMHKLLLQRKNFYEMTGNNVNHPNDFLHRCYAQIILSLMEEEQ